MSETFVYSAASPLWRRPQREKPLAKQAFISIVNLADFHGRICSSLLFMAAIQLQAHMHDTDLDELILSDFHLGQTGQEHQTPSVTWRLEMCHCIATKFGDTF